MHWLVEHKPQTLWNGLEHLIYTCGGHIRILWNPPSCPETNAIEMLWAQMKLYVGLDPDINRTVARTMSLMRDALYTDKRAGVTGTEVTGVDAAIKLGPDGTPQKCPRVEALIDHVLTAKGKGIDALIKMDPKFSVLDRVDIYSLPLKREDWEFAYTMFYRNVEQWVLQEELTQDESDEVEDEKDDHDVDDED
jgi:hypothetical protein